MSKPVISLDFGDDEEDIFVAPKAKTVGTPTFKKKTIKNLSRRVKRTLDEEEEEEDVAEVAESKPSSGPTRMVSKFKNFSIEKKPMGDRLARLKKYGNLEDQVREEQQGDKQPEMEELIEREDQIESKEQINGAKDEESDLENTPVVVETHDLNTQTPKNTAFKTFEEYRPIKIDREATGNLIPDFDQRFFRDEEPKLTLENEYGDNNDDDGFEIKPKVKETDLEEDNVMDLDEFEGTREARQFAVNDEVYDLELSSDSESEVESSTATAVPLVTVRSIPDMVGHLVDSIQSLKLLVSENETELADINQQLQDIENSKQQLLQQLQAAPEITG